MTKFEIRSLNRTDLTIHGVDWKDSFSPLNTDFYAFASEHGVHKCPTLVPSFSIACDKDGKCVGIETYLESYWSFVDGISQKFDERIYDIFRLYIKEKYSVEDVFNLSTPAEASKALKFICGDK